MACGALILAAGASTRLGSPKQLICIDGETLLERTIRVAHGAGCSPVVVVLGAFEAEIRASCDLGRAVVVSHAQWDQGMGTSLAQGMTELAEASGVIVMTCDMPAVSAAHLRALAASDAVTGSCYGGRRGVPAYFPRSSFSQLRALTGDAGARALLRDAPCVELSNGELDVDTPEDLLRIREVFSVSSLNKP